MRCRCKKLSRCSTIARARCCAIRLESTNCREAVQENPECGSRNFAISNSSISRPANFAPRFSSRRKQIRRQLRNVEIDSCAPAQLKLVRCPAHSPLPSRSGGCRIAFPKSSIRPLGLPIYVARVPAAPLMRSLPRDLSVTLTDLTVHLARSHGSVHSVLSSRLYLLFRNSRFLNSSIEAMSCGKHSQEKRMVGL